MGCAKSTYHPPCICPPEKWEADAPLIELEEKWPDYDWWKSFNQPELSSLIELSIQNNYDLKAAISRIYEAKANLQIATSSLFPMIDLLFSKTKIKSPANNISNASGIAGSTNVIYDIELDASLPVDLWGKNQYGIEASLATLHSTVFDMQTIQLLITSTVASTYFQILDIKDRINIADETVVNQREVLRVLDVRFRLGAASLFDVSQQQAQLDIVLATIPPLEQQRDQLINALAVLIGGFPEGFAICGQSLNEITRPSSLPEGIPSGLIQRNPLIRRSEALLIAANANIEVARAAFFPQVLLTGVRGYRNTSLSHLLMPQNLFYQFTANAVQRIFDGGLLIGEFQYAKNRYYELLFNYYQSILVGFREVENSLIAIEKTIEAEDAQDLAVSSSKESYRLANIQFMNGLIDTTTVLLIQRTLLNTRDSQSQAQLAKLNAFISLYVALGGGWNDF
jgi:multidrug efflux system outer membrane protein